MFLVPALATTALLCLAVFAAVSYRALLAKKATLYHSGSDRLARILDRCAGLHKPFKPVYWMRNGFFQTFGVAIPSLYAPPRITYERQLLALDDGGQVGLDWARELQRGCTAASPVLVVLHGLNGGSRESYVMHMCASAAARGWRPVVMIARGLGGIKLRSWRPYNAGWTEDVRQAVATVRARYPQAPVFLVGYSLGANVVTRYVAEEGESCVLTAAAAISSPLDLRQSTEWMDRRGLVPSILSDHLVQGLVRYTRRHADVLRKSPHLEGLDALATIERALRSRTVAEYDEYGTARIFGYASAGDYYESNSSMPLLPRVRVPLLHVNAVDDPVTGPHVPFEAAEAVRAAGRSCAAAVAVVEGGGHVAFLEGVLKPRSSWADRAACDFFQAALDVPPQ
eukprot:m51a1_g12198 hypothetical protein (397) ;mRNA; r:46794-48693